MQCLLGIKHWEHNSDNIEWFLSSRIGREGEKELNKQEKYDA